MTPITMLAFLRLSRLKFLAGGLLGGALGTAVAAFLHGRIDWGAYGLAQATITSLHLMTHYSNEYFDYEQDAWCKPSPFSGGSGALSMGGLSPRVALIAAVVCAAGGLVGSALLVTTGRSASAALAIAIAILAWIYSAPPLRLCARGLGEIDAAIVVGMLVPLCADAAQARGIDPLAIVSTIPVTATMFVMMIAVEVPDAAADRAAGKRNLVARAEPRRWWTLVLAALAVTVAGTLAAPFAGAPLPVLPLVAIALPCSIGLCSALRGGSIGGAEAHLEVAGRGVSVFVLVCAGSLLGYLTALP